MSFIVKNTTFPGLLDLISPHSCRGCGRIGNALCDCCKNNIINQLKKYCPNCKKVNPTGKCPNCPDLPPIFIVGPRDELIGTLIQDLKFHSVRALATPIAEIIQHTLPKIDQKLIIVPLPTISKHIRERGLDHTLLIAKKLSKYYPNSSVQKILIRGQNTIQVGTDETTRVKQASRAYKINPKAKISSSVTYLLLDDVWTTGASMKSALKKLREAGAQNILISILAVNRLN